MTGQGYDDKYWEHKRGFPEDSRQGMLDRAQDNYENYMRSLEKDDDKDLAESMCS